MDCSHDQGIPTQSVVGHVVKPHLHLSVLAVSSETLQHATILCTEGIEQDK